MVPGGTYEASVRPRHVCVLHGVDVTQIAVLNSSSALKNVDVAFLVEAVSNQLVEFCQAWNLEPWAVSFYNTAVGLPADDVFIFEYVDRLDVDGALAYHSTDALGRPYGRMLAPNVFRIQGVYPDDATDLSHEVLETRGDPTCDRWMKMPNGSECAVEVADPCQDDWYPVDATVLGETRRVALSDYVLPGFFDATSTGPFDRQGKIGAPFGMSSGGYEAILDQSGNEHDVFARVSGVVPTYKLRDSGGRLMRRLRATR